MPEEKRITAKALRLQHQKNEKFEQDKHELLGFYVFRPVSFYPTAWFLNRGISANQTSWVSIAILVLGCLMLAVGDYWVAVAGALFTNIWIILDFVDGNIARYQKSCSNYGEFLDALGAVIAHLVFFALGIGVHLGGYYSAIEGAGTSLFVNDTVSVMMLGAWASLSAIWIRAVFQKFRNTFKDSSLHRYEIVGAGESFSSLRLAKTIINNVFDFSGLLLPLLLLSVVFRFSDILIVCVAILNTAILAYSLVYIIKQASSYD